MNMRNDIVLARLTLTFHKHSSQLALIGFTESDTKVNGYISLTG